jgi:tRNA 2-thiouridine synthesizing protein D
MTSIAVVIGSAPYTKERPYTALRFVNTALLDGHSVKLFLVEDGIFVAKKSQNPTEYPNLVEWLEQGLEEGLVVKACGVCLKARGVAKEELVEGVGLGSMHDFVSFVADSDKCIFF